MEKTNKTNKKTERKFTDTEVKMYKMTLETRIKDLMQQWVKKKQWASETGSSSRSFAHLIKCRNVETWPLSE